MGVGGVGTGEDFQDGDIASWSSWPCADGSKAHFVKTNPSGLTCGICLLHSAKRLNIPTLSQIEKAVCSHLDYSNYYQYEIHRAVDIFKWLFRVHPLAFQSKLHFVDSAMWIDLLLSTQAVCSVCHDLSKRNPAELPSLCPCPVLPHPSFNVFPSSFWKPELQILCKASVLKKLSCRLLS